MSLVFLILGSVATATGLVSLGILGRRLGAMGNRACTARVSAPNTKTKARSPLGDDDQERAQGLRVLEFLERAAPNYSFDVKVSAGALLSPVADGDEGDRVRWSYGAGVVDLVARRSGSRNAAALILFPETPRARVSHKYLAELANDAGYLVLNMDPAQIKSVRAARQALAPLLRGC